LQGSLEDRAKYAQVLDDENKHLKSEIEKMRQEMDDLRAQLEKEKENSNKLHQHKVELEHQIEGLNGQIFSNNEKFAKEREDNNSKGNVQLKGLGVLKKNLEEHIEDLHRWQKYLDFDKTATVDFSGEIRPQILHEIADKNYDVQLNALATKLAKENTELEGLLKGKEEEKKAQKAKEEEKKKKKSKDNLEK